MSSALVGTFWWMVLHCRSSCEWESSGGMTGSRIWGGPHPLYENPLRITDRLAAGVHWSLPSVMFQGRPARSYLLLGLYLLASAQGDRSPHTMQITSHQTAVIPNLKFHGPQCCLIQNVLSTYMMAEVEASTQSSCTKSF